MANTDPRLCSHCGVAREINTCTQMEERHCRECHLEMHGEAPPVMPAEEERCRDCQAPVTWYAPDGTAFCDEHGKVPVV